MVHSRDGASETTHMATEELFMTRRSHGMNTWGTGGTGSVRAKELYSIEVALGTVEDGGMTYATAME